MMQTLSNIDYNIFLALNSLAGQNSLLDKLFVILAADLTYVMVAILAVYWFALEHRAISRKALMVTFVSFVLARGILAEVIRALVPRDRPFISYSVTELLLKGNEPSFPSGHATAMFAIATGIYFYNKRIGKWLFVIAAATAISRIIVGVHYPADIVAGAVLGIATAWLVEKLIGKHPLIENIADKFSRLSDRIFPWTKAK